MSCYCSDNFPCVKCQPSVKLASEDAAMARLTHLYAVQDNLLTARIFLKDIGMSTGEVEAAEDRVAREVAYVRSRLVALKVKVTPK